MDSSATERAVLPSSRSVLEAFGTSGPHEDPIVECGRALAEHHAHQWRAEEVSRLPDVDTRVVGEVKRLIDALNGHRVALVARIEAAVDRMVADSPRATLHTETLGSVVDRIAIAWVRAASVQEASDRVVARQQLADLAAAYDGLVGEVLEGTRRLPRWRVRKHYDAALGAPRTQSLGSTMDVALEVDAEHEDHLPVVIESLLVALAPETTLRLWLLVEEEFTDDLIGRLRAQVGRRATAEFLPRALPLRHRLGVRDS